MGKWVMVHALMLENAAANMAGVELALSIVVAHPTGFQQARMRLLGVIVVLTGLPRAHALSHALVVWIVNAHLAKLASERLSAAMGALHAMKMEQFVFLVLLVHRVATENPSGQITASHGLVANGHALDLIHVALKDRPAIAAAMDLFGGNFIGGVITATKGKGDLGWSEKSGEWCVRILELA